MLSDKDHEGRVLIHEKEPPDLGIMTRLSGGKNASEGGWRDAACGETDQAASNRSL